MRHLKIVSVLIIIANLLLAGCVTAPQEQAGGGNNANPGGKIRIGFSMATLKEERWNVDKKLFEEHAKALGADVSITVADNKEEKQTNDVDNLLTKGIDVLVIAPQNAVQAATMVEKAKAQGVPVISYDRLIKSDKLDLYVSHQVERIGVMQATYALQHAPKGNYIMVYGASTDNNANLLKAAQLKTLQPAIDKGDIKIVVGQEATDWLPSEARKIVENGLTQNNNNVKAVVASNDGTASGAIESLAAQGLSGTVVVTGQDAELAALQRIAKGTQSMTIYKPIKPLAYGAVEAAIALAKKEKPQTNGALRAVNNEIPSILYDPIVVDKDNIMSTVVKDGYHTADEIYKDVPRPSASNVLPKSNVQSPVSKVLAGLETRRREAEFQSENLLICLGFKTERNGLWTLDFGLRT